MALFLVLNRPVTLSSVLKTLPSGVHALTLGCSFSHSSRGTSLSVSLPSSPSLLRFSSPMPFFIITINSPCPPLLEVAGPPSYIPFQLSVLRPSHVPFFFFYTLLTPLGLWERLMGSLGQDQQTSLKVASTSQASFCVSSPAAGSPNAPL